MTAPVSDPTSSPTITSQSDARAGIDATNRRFEELFNGGDPAAAARATYTRDARILPPGGGLIQGRDDAASFWPAAAQQMGIKGVALTTVELELVGGSAHEIGRAMLTLANGQTVPVKYVVIWRHEDGQWRWHVDIWNAEGT